MKISLKASITALAVVAATLAFAGDFTWTGGGVAGDWTDSENWDARSGYPQAGDTATFNGDATITSDFSLGGEEGTAEVLTVTIADGATLTIDASISGEGGFTREGSGTLVLMKANPFKGKFKANGWTAQDSSKANIYTKIFDGGALGVQSASFDNGLIYSFASLWIDAGGGTANVTVPLTLCRLQSNTGHPNLCIRNGAVVFEKRVNFPGRLVFGGDSTVGNVTFLATIYGNGTYFQPSSAIPSGREMHFYGPVSNCTFYGWNNYSTYHFHAPYNNPTFQFNWHKVYCYTNEVFASTSRSTFPWENHSLSKASRIDLGGFDQRFPNVTAGKVLASNTSPFAPIYDFGFTSPEGKPAKVILSGAKMKTQYYNGQFFGTAGFEWNPNDTSAEFVFSNNINTTSGELAISNGAVRLSGGASFSSLSALTVASKAALRIDADSGAPFFASNITVAADSVLEIPAGVALVTKRFAVGDNVVTAVGRYTAAEYPDLISGAGSVEIRGEPCSFTGANGVLWSDPENWDGGKVPGAQSSVTIPAGKTVLLDATNDEVYSLSVGDGKSAATLMMTNWNTCLRAKYVEVLNKGVITTPGAFEQEEEKCRVWIRCTDLNVASGGSIGMKGKGWMGGHYDLRGLNKSTSPNPTKDYPNADGIANGGFGPGRTKGRVTGPSHFGRGLCSTAHNPGNFGALYDDPAAPAEPGTGGHGLGVSAYSQAWEPSPSGGGAVFIEASGAVVVNGTIDASAIGATSHSYYLNDDSHSHADDANCGGSGGSVRIVCETVSGTGVIRADGGNGTYGVVPNTFYKDGLSETCMPGGGGGIAISYNAEKQVVGACAGMTISAAAGRFHAGDATTWGVIDRYRAASEPGTLKFTDAKLVDDTIGRGLTGRLYDLESYTYEGDLDWTEGYVRFGATGALFTVTGDLTLGGAMSRLDIGGNRIEITDAARPYVDAGDQQVRLAVGGDLSVSGGAALAVYAAKVSDTATEWGAEVAVAGAFTVGDGGFVYPQCDYVNLGAPHFTAGSFTVAAGGRVDADHRGGSGAWEGDTYIPFGKVQRGVGPGAGLNAAGASYGGRGAKGANGDAKVGGTVGAVYGDSYNPVFGGSGGGSSGYAAGGDGGGIFHLTASGPVTVDGTVTADGVASHYQNNEAAWYVGAGSGGAVYLAGTTFAGAATALISARGGDTRFGRNGIVGGCGGGGRIALWFGGDKLSERHSTRHATDRNSDRLLGGFAGWKGRTDASGGTNCVFATYTATYEPTPSTFGNEGTVTYNGAFDPFGMLLLVR